MPREVAIRGDTIRLGQLLKLAGVVGGGGELKAFLAAETVLVNGEPRRAPGPPAAPGRRGVGGRRGAPRDAA